MNFEELLSEMLKGTPFERNHENLSKSAEKADDLATNVETAFDGLMGFLEAAQETVTEFVANLRTAADQLREEAFTKAESPYDSVRPQGKKASTATREEKVAYIQGKLRAAGITSSSKWMDEAYTAIAPDKIIDYTYKLFGGK